MLGFAALSAWLPASAQSTPIAPEASVGLAQARTESASGEPAAALGTLTAMLQRDPRNAEAWLELGLLEGQLHRFPEAEQSLRRAVALAPGNARSHYTLGLSLVADPHNKLDWPGAIAEFQAAVRLQPGYADALTYLGAGLGATGKPAEAVDALQQAVAANPNLPAAQFNLALALQAVDRNAEAASAFRKAIALRPPFPEASSALGKLLAATGDNAGAERELRSALRANPDLQDAHQALGQVLRATHRTSEATIEFAEAAALGQREPDGIAASQLSNAALKTAAVGKLTEAVAMLRRAVLLRPDYGVPHHNLGLLLADTGDLPGAVRELSIAVSLLPSQGRPWFDLGRVLLLQEKQAEATACLRWAYRLQPGDAQIAEALRKLSSATPAIPADEPPHRPGFGAAAETAAAHAAFAAQLRAANDLPGEAAELLHALSLQPAGLAERRRLATVYRLLGDGKKADLEDRKIALLQTVAN